MQRKPQLEGVMDTAKNPAQQNEQNEMRIAELLIKQRELEQRNKIMEKQCATLDKANKKLVAHNDERKKLNSELCSAYKQLKKADDYLKEYTKGLEEMMHITSHKVRQPVANILGITGIISSFINSPKQLRKLVEYLQTSAVSLDLFTKELTDFVFVLDQKGRAQVQHVSST